MRTYIRGMLGKYLIETTSPEEFRKAVDVFCGDTKVWRTSEQSDFDIRVQCSTVRNLKLTRLCSRSGYRFSRPVYDGNSLAILLVRSGPVEFKRRSGNTRIDGGMAYLVAKGDEIAFSAAPGSSLICAEIPQARYASLASAHATDPKERLAGLEAIADIEANNLAILEQMAMVLIGGDSQHHPFANSPFAALRLKEAIIAAFVEQWPSRQAASGVTAYGGTIQRAISWIHENLSKNFTVEDVAREIGVSVRGLQQSFKDELETSPNHYVQKLRLQNAHGDLLDPSCTMSVSEIAYRWGFRHLGYFASRYRAVYGETPSETRKKRFNIAT